MAQFYGAKTQLEEERKQAQIVAILENRRDVLENDPNAPVLGNPNGEVTIVEFKMGEF